MWRGEIGRCKVRSLAQDYQRGGAKDQAMRSLPSRIPRAFSSATKAAAKIFAAARLRQSHQIPSRISRPVSSGCCKYLPDRTGLALSVVCRPSLLCRGRESSPRPSGRSCSYCVLRNAFAPPLIGRSWSADLQKFPPVN